MSFSRDSLAARHPLATEPIRLPPIFSIDVAVALEKQGNWFAAGEAYIEVDDRCGVSLDGETRARVLARAATCFDIASRPESAARAYSDAARLLAQLNIRNQSAGELFNRSARQHYEANEFFFAGTSWRAAATEFSKIGKTVIVSRDGMPPVPMSAAGLTVAGACFEAAAEAFARSVGNEMWACGAYWESGNAYGQTFPSPNIQTYNAYRNALNVTIKYYGTLELERIRQTLPFSEAERQAKVNPLKVLEESLFRCNHHHQPAVDEQRRAAVAGLETDRQLSAAFHDFSLLLLEVGNAREAGLFRAVEKERQRKVFFAEKRYGRALLYWLWRIAANYGESLGRWIFWCSGVTVLFSALYYAFGALSFGGRDGTWFDYVYYSIVTFTSLGAGDISPSGLAGKILICAEIVFGLMMFGMLLSFVGNRVQR